MNIYLSLENLIEKNKNPRIINCFFDSIQINPLIEIIETESII